MSASPSRSISRRLLCSQRATEATTAFRSRGSATTSRWSGVSTPWPTERSLGTPKGPIERVSASKAAPPSIRPSPSEQPSTTRLPAKAFSSHHDLRNGEGSAERSTRSSQLARFDPRDDISTSDTSGRLTWRPSDLMVHSGAHPPVYRRVNRRMRWESEILGFSSPVKCCRGSAGCQVEPNGTPGRVHPPLTVAPVTRLHGRCRSGWIDKSKQGRNVEDHRGEQPLGREICS